VAAERDALMHASGRAVGLVTRGVVLLVAILPLLLAGGFCSAIFDGTSRDTVISGVLWAIGVCAVAGLALVVVGLGRHAQLQRRIYALDHAALPVARVVR
jgi:hypothetical protein